MNVMRLVLAMVLAGLAALPLSVGAQGGEEGATSAPNLQESASSSEPAPEEGGLSPRIRKRTRKKWDPQTYDVPASRPSSEEPALQLELDSAGAGFTLIPPSQPSKRVLDARRRAGIGVGVSVVAFVAGLGMVGAAAAGSCFISFEEPCSSPSWVAPVGITGAFLAVGGIVGMAVSGSEMRNAERDRDSLRKAHYGTPRRVQWDLAQSRLVF